MKRFGGLLSQALKNLAIAQSPPDAHREMRKFSSIEVASLLGVTDSYIRQTLIKEPSIAADVGSQNGRRQFSLDQILELRMMLAQNGRKKWMNPRRVGDDKCQIIAVTNFKGGSSKTSTTIHLGHYLALRGYRVLAVDLDPQASLTALHGPLATFDPIEGETLYGAIRFDETVPTRDLIHRTHIAGFDVICAGLDLIEFETAVALELNKKGGVRFLTRVGEALAQVSDDYDVILLDSAPSLNFLTLSSLTAATGILIPVPAHMLDVDSTGKFLELTSTYMDVLSGAGTTVSWDFAKFLVTKFEPNDAPQVNMMVVMRQVFGDELLLNMVAKSTAVADALTFKQSLYEMQRSRFPSPKTYDRAIESLNAANAEIEKLLWKAWGRE
jgi:chromosome partitioning protein